MIVPKYLISYAFQLSEREQPIGPYRAHLKSYHYHPSLSFDRGNLDSFGHVDSLSYLV
jgi:hypothetical protein